MKRIDLTGQVFGLLTVIGQDFNWTLNKQLHWLCECSCGNTKIKSIASGDLRYHKVKSCGCEHKRIASKTHYKHGDSHTPFYQSYCDMIKRCKSIDMKLYYMDRNITVCDRWSDPENGYENFKKDMYQLYLQAASLHSKVELDRKDNNGIYSPENCRWVNHQQNQSNKRTNRQFKATYIISGPSFGYIEIANNRYEFARKYGLTHQLIEKCLKKENKTHKGWTFEFI